MSALDLARLLEYGIGGDFLYRDKILWWHPREQQGWVMFSPEINSDFREWSVSVGLGKIGNAKLTDSVVNLDGTPWALV